jgi:hypothetical protein
MQAEYTTMLPKRWGPRIDSLRKSGLRPNISNEIWEIQNEKQRIPICATEGRISFEARKAAKECYEICGKQKESKSILDDIEGICIRYGIGLPDGNNNIEKIRRAIDAPWWNRQLRKEVTRRFEHTSIKMGFTGIKTGPYISNESALRQLKRNIQNAKLLEATEMENENGQSYKMSELAALGPANKEIRRGELMVRIRGFEEIAKECGHVGQFWTITCPSEYHSVGGENVNYSGATPREAQAYLVHAWALMRSRLARQGLKMYGFRIAEPHTDGCPHWHMLLFVGPTQQPEAWHPPMKTKYIQRNAEEAATRIRRVITVLSRAYMPHENGAKENRVKLIRIEAGKGTAAGYIAKYVAKNIDGVGVGDHKTKDGYTIVPDMFGKHEITPSQRVTYWAQLHGIRQFQQIGGAPIGTWRELRRIKAEIVQDAPDAVKSAWRAVQKIESDDPTIAKQADFAEYVRVQGGPFIGRAAQIQLAKKETEIDGRYGKRIEGKPCGIYLRKFVNAVYESVRYRWIRKEAVGVAFDFPWTGVNNCTQLDARLSKKMRAATSRLACEVKKKVFPVQYLIDWHGIVKRGRDIEKQTWKFSQLKR